jgi:hypothetical protein
MKSLAEHIPLAPKTLCTPYNELHSLVMKMRGDEGKIPDFLSVEFFTRGHREAGGYQVQYSIQRPSP